MNPIKKLRSLAARKVGITRLWQEIDSMRNELDDRLNAAESRIALDLSLLVKQGPKGTLYVRLPSGTGSVREPWKMGTVWAHVDVLDWVSDESLIQGPVTRMTKDGKARVQQFKEAGGGGP